MTTGVLYEYSTIVYGAYQYPGIGRPLIGTCRGEEYTCIRIAFGITTITPISAEHLPAAWLTVGKASDRFAKAELVFAVARTVPDGCVSVHPFSFAFARQKCWTARQR